VFALVLAPTRTDTLCYTVLSVENESADADVYSSIASRIALCTDDISLLAFAWLGIGASEPFIACVTKARMD
jgi:hypothetical protein